MRKVIWTDENGYKRASLVKDNDSDVLARTVGIRLDPPNLNELNWEGMVKDLHNLLVEKGLYTWSDVQAQQNGVSSSILTIFKRPIVALYRQREGTTED